ncbi:MAG TPA: hypothetical protein VFD58_29710 [Blastocatellia bacterium]|nr:hypothetical protein [Blastocatellia bacterium]
MTFEYISRVTVIGAALLLCLIAGSTRAQTTIFNMPSTDVASKGGGSVRFDFISHLEGDEDGGFRTYLPRAAFGLGKGFEIGVNVGTTTSLAPTSVYIQPNIKWQFYHNESAGTALSGGAILFAPLRNRDTSDTFGLFYANGSKKFQGSRGPRFTVGAYGLTGVSADVDKAGAMIAYEQPLVRRLSFVTDWMSGNNGFGYTTPGLSLDVTRTSTFKVGYSIGNYQKKNNGLFLSYGLNF